MSDIALYNALTKLGLKPDEAEKATADVASSKEIVTKVDVVRLESFVKESIASLETRLTKQMYQVAVLILAGVGLMIKFL